MVITHLKNGVFGAGGIGSLSSLLTPQHIWLTLAKIIDVMKEHVGLCILMDTSYQVYRVNRTDRVGDREVNSIPLACCLWAAETQVYEISRHETGH